MKPLSNFHGIVVRRFVELHEFRTTIVYIIYKVTFCSRCKCGLLVCRSAKSDVYRSELSTAAAHKRRRHSRSGEQAEVLLHVQNISTSASISLQRLRQLCR